MKKKMLNAKRSEGRGKTDPSPPARQEAPGKSTSPRLQRLDQTEPPRTAPTASQRQEAGARKDPARQIEPPPTVPTEERGAPQSPDRGDSDEAQGTGETDEFDEAVVEHVQLLASLIDEVDLSREETIEQLRRIMRQHSMWKETGLDYALRQVKAKPP